MSLKGHVPASPVGAAVYAVVEAQSESFRHLSLLDKLALWASWAAAGGIFLTLGWMAMAPDDPYGAVSLLLRGQALGMWLQAAGLAVVTSAIATILVGRSLPYAGPFAAALGLAVVSLRGRTAESLLVAARTSGVGTNSLAIRMSLEALAWIGVMVLAFGAAEGIVRWCFPQTTLRDDGRANAAKRLPAPTLAFAALGISLLAFNVLGAGMYSREIRHPQVCFVVAASVWLGCYFGYRLVPSRGILWHVAAVVLLVLCGYGWAAFQGDGPNLPVSVPPSNFLRVLPIQFVAVGVAAAIAAYWSILNHQSQPFSVDDASMDDSEDGA